MGVGIDMHNISLFLYISITVLQLLERIILLCQFNFLLYKMNNFYMKLMNKM